tara:strand:- start:71 stop:910 length:840 start_codon:yes stop_codon:yes gene_type:complete
LSEPKKSNPLEEIEKAAHPLDKLEKLMKALRDPQHGCPWDLKQNFKTIAPYTIEEAYEVADAIDKNDMENLREELGDLLFQSVYHAQMASELGIFTLTDVINDITNKMIYRHPHVFANDGADNEEDVRLIWEQRKAAEKSTAQAAEAPSALDGIPLNLPALMRAQKIQKKAAKANFEWKNAHHILDKLEEEITELREAIDNETIEEQKDELGDLLFVLANFARNLNIDAEESVRSANAKFERRFKGMEIDAKLSGKEFKDHSHDEMKQLWIKQKHKEAK